MDEDKRYDQFLDNIEYDQELDVPKWLQIKACENIRDHKEIDYGHQINLRAHPRYDD